MFFGCRGECALLLPDRNSDAGCRTICSSRVPKQSPTAALSQSGAGWVCRPELDEAVESALPSTPPPPPAWHQVLRWHWWHVPEPGHPRGGN